MFFKKRVDDKGGRKDLEEGFLERWKEKE